jgi:hypothetical protein
MMIPRAIFDHVIAPQQQINDLQQQFAAARRHNPLLRGP